MRASRSPYVYVVRNHDATPKREELVAFWMKVPEIMVSDSGTLAYYPGAPSASTVDFTDEAFGSPEQDPDSWLRRTGAFGIWRPEISRIT